MWCALEDFLFYFFLVLFSCLDWDVNVIMGVRASLTLVEREENSRLTGHKLGLHDWGPWSMGSIVFHFHSYSSLGLIREKWWRKEVNEVWDWRKLKLLVVCGGGCLSSPKRAWYFSNLWSPKRVWYFLNCEAPKGHESYLWQIWYDMVNLLVSTPYPYVQSSTSGPLWKYIGMGLLSVEMWCSCICKIGMKLGLDLVSPTQRVASWKPRLGGEPPWFSIIFIFESFWCTWVLKSHEDFIAWEKEIIY